MTASVRLALGTSLLLALPAAWGCSSATDSSGGTDTIPTPTVQFAGADISALEKIEQAGGVFRDSGQARDAIAILRAHGSNLFRLRLFVSPNHADVQVNDIDYTVRMAQRIKAAHARFLLDIHYSDTWADPSHQTTPAAWAGLALDSLKKVVESYTAGVMVRLRQAGALPDIVQVGNEVDGGMLWPQGQLTYDATAATSWDHFTQLLKAAISGVRDSLTANDTVRVMVHYSLGGNSGGTQWFFDNLATYGVSYDLIGLSYYPWWHGTLSALAANLNATAARYGKDIIVVEASYPWRAGGWESMVVDTPAMTYAATPHGQAQFLGSLVAAVAAVPGRHGIGVVFWYPESIQVPGIFAWAGGSMALFDAGGNVLEGAGSLKSR